MSSPTVTHVSEHVLPMSPVHTLRAGWSPPGARPPLIAQPQPAPLPHFGFQGGLFHRPVEFFLRYAYLMSEFA